MSFREKVLSALKWTLIGRVSTQFASWAITILVMRLLAPEDYGLVAMATVFSGLLALVAEVGLGSSMVQAQEVSEQQRRQVFGIVILSNMAVVVSLVFVIGPLSAWFFDEPRLSQLLAVISLQFLPAAFSVLPGALLDREMLYKGRNIVEFFASISGGLLTIALAYGGYGAWSLAWGTVLSAFVRAVGLNAITPHHVLPSFHFQGSGQMFRFGRDITLNQLVYYLYGQADSFIIGKLLGKHDLGLYSVSMNLASLPASRIASILNQVAFPALSKVKRDGGDVKPYILASIRGISLIAFPVMWGMSSVAQEIVNGILGNQWAAAIAAFSILCLVMPLRVLGPIIHAGLQSVGRADVSFKNTCTAAVVMCISFVFGCRFGLTGLAITWVVVFPVVFIANLNRARSHLGIRVTEVMVVLAKPIAASVAMYGAVCFARPLLEGPPLINLGILALLGAVIYIGTSLMVNREGIAEATRLLRPQKA